VPKNAQDSRSPTRAKAGEAFPRLNRLRGRTAIRDTAFKGEKYRGKWLGLSVIKGDSTRFGIGISRKFGKAVRRNRVKRLIREFLRTNKALWPENRWTIIRLFKDPGDEAAIIEELKALISKIK
jgi:ribonuclease P protein component